MTRHTHVPIGAEPREGCWLFWDDPKAHVISSRRRLGEIPINLNSEVHSQKLSFYHFYSQHLQNDGVFCNEVAFLAEKLGFWRSQF